MSNKKYFTNINNEFFVQDEEATLKLINVSYTFDTTINMLKQDLKNNDMILTQGYSLINDGGGALFKITDTKPTNDIYFFTLNNGLYAIIVPMSKMNVLQFGIIGDGSTDITEKYQKAINFISKYGDSYIYVPKGTYMIDGVDHDKTPSDTGHLLNKGGIGIPNGFHIVHDNNAIMKCIPTNYQQYNVYRLYQVNSIIIEGGIIDGSRSQHFGEYGGEWGYGIALTGAYNILIRNIYVKNCWGDGINIQYAFSETTGTKSCYDITILDCTCTDNRRNAISIENGSNINIENCKFLNSNGTLPESGIDLEPANQNSPIDRVYFRNCYIDGNNNKNITMYSAFNNSKITNIYFINCYIRECHNSDKYSVTLEANATQIYFLDNIFYHIDAHTIVINGSNNITFNGNTFTNTDIYSNAINTLTFINNIINSYSADNFMTCYKIGDWYVMNNIFKQIRNRCIETTSDNKTNFIFKNNVVNSVGAGNAVFTIDNSPSLQLIAVDNILLGTNTKLTEYTLNSNQIVSQGAFGGLQVYVERPKNARVGMMAFENNSGKLIVFNGTKWVFADGTNA